MFKKQMLSLLCAFCLLTPCMTAFAEDAELISTQACLEWMREDNVECELLGMEGDGEHVLVKVATADGYPMEISLCFLPDGRSCCLSTEGLIIYQQSQLLQVLKLCNDLNSEFRFVRFYAEENTRMVKAALDVRFLGPEVGEAVGDAMQTLLEIVRVGLSELAPLSGR